MSVITTIKKLRIQKIKNYVNRTIEMNKWNKVDLSNTKHLDLPKLTSVEFELLQKTWPCFKFRKKDVLWARVFKKEFGFDPYYISVGYHSILIKQRLNPHDQVCSLENKALVDVYFPEIRFPQTYVRCINSVLYDKEMNRISFEDAVRFLKEKKQFVIKPALNSMQGVGVKKIDLQQIDNVTKEWFKDLFSNATANYIIQEVVVQHPDLACLNPTSLNCCRITSIYIEGKFSYGALLKIGKKGATVDNWHSSYFVGISKEGVLYDVGWDNLVHSVTKTDNGILFGGIKYPYFDSVVSSIESYHKKYFPQCGVIGWDVLIDANNKPIVIEANLVIPGIMAEQLCSGPFFKDVHDELVKRFN